MNDQLRQLISLTEVDHAMAELREQLGRYPAMIAKMDAAEARQQKLITEAEAVLEVARHDRRGAEKELATLREKIRKYGAQQSAVKTNKEYQAITQEIEQTRGKMDEWETLGLEKLEVEERCTAQRKAAADQLAKLKAEYADERQRIETQVREKKEKLQRLTSERNRKFEEVPEEFKQIYDLLNERNPGTACVPLDGENCGGCHWHLFPQMCQLVRRGEEMIRCDHCHRFLYAKNSL